MLANEPASAGASPDHLIAWPTASLRSRRLGPVERFFLALIQSGTPHAACTTFVAPEPWENASREPLETALLRHSFQDANYHDQIVNERRRAGDDRSRCRLVGGNRSREKWDRPRQIQNLATAFPTVKRPEKSVDSGRFSPSLRGYNRNPWYAAERFMVRWPGWVWSRAWWRPPARRVPNHQEKRRPCPSWRPA